MRADLRVERFLKKSLAVPKPALFSFPAFLAHTQCWMRGRLCRGRIGRKGLINVARRHMLTRGTKFLDSGQCCRTNAVSTMDAGPVGTAFIGFVRLASMQFHWRMGGARSWLKMVENNSVTSFLSVYSGLSGWRRPIRFHCTHAALFDTHPVWALAPGNVEE